MAKKNYEIMVDDKTQLRDVNEILANVKKVCDKVEKAQDEYKKCAELVYLLHKHKVHKAAGMSFTDYMRAHTGMGATTAKSLVRIWCYREMVKDTFTDGALSELSEFLPDILEFYDSMSMRDLLLASDPSSNLFDTAIREYYIVDSKMKVYESLEDAWEECKRLHYNTIEQKEQKEDSKEQKEDSKEQKEDSKEQKEDSKEQTVDAGMAWKTFTVSDSADMSALLSELTAMLQDGILEVRARITN